MTSVTFSAFSGVCELKCLSSQYYLSQMGNVGTLLSIFGITTLISNQYKPF